jgi:hypothetical protein
MIHASGGLLPTWLAAAFVYPLLALAFVAVMFGLAVFALYRRYGRRPE